MPTVTSGVYKITLKMSLNAQVIFNTFHYLETLERDDQQANAADALDEDIIPGMSLVQATGLTYTEIRAENLTGTLADAIKVPTTTAGTTLGTRQQSYVAAGFKRARTTKETRNGSMRIGGLTEDDTTANLYEAAYITLLNTLAVTLGTQIGVVGALFDLVILKTRPLGTEPFVVNPVSVVTRDANPTTQTSRKAGVGI